MLLGYVNILSVDKKTSYLVKYVDGTGLFAALMG